MNNKTICGRLVDIDDISRTKLKEKEIWIYSKKVMLETGIENAIVLKCNTKEEAEKEYETLLTYIT